MFLTYPSQPCPTQPTLKYAGGKVIVGPQGCRLATNSLWTKSVGNLINCDTTGPSPRGGSLNSNGDSTPSGGGFQKDRRR